jgi:NAD+ synthase (glutamine-hydrolysing)
MRSVRIGLANINTTVGALRSNMNKVIARASEMAGEKCIVGCFSEQVISGYPVEDLVGWKGFVDAQWRELLRFAEATKGHKFPTVFVLGLTVRVQDENYNCAAVLQNGKVLGIVPKEKLPAYDVFYENRMYSSGKAGFRTELNGVPFGDLIFRFPFGCLATEVCEDGWVTDGPIRRRAFSGAELVVNVSASPWRGGIVAQRRQHVAARSRENRVAYVYVNQVGAQDSLVFDGGSFVCSSGDIVAETDRWQEQLSVVTIDLDVITRTREADKGWSAQRDAWLKSNDQVFTVDAPELPESQSRVLQDTLSSRPAVSKSQVKDKLSANLPTEYFDELLAAMKLGLKDYFEKTGAFKTIGVAVSGGKDSALTLMVAWLYAREKFGHLKNRERDKAIRDFVRGFSMPSRYNSEVTRNVARELCENLGVGFTEVPIEDAFEREVDATRALLSGADPTAMTLQNIQARIRGMRMWNWANSAQGLWLQSGNMSEKAVGYTTIGGDLMGGYSLIGNLPKTTVIALLHHLNSRYQFPSLEKLLPLQASAELKENQSDEKELMPFEVLDACYALFAGEKQMPLELYRNLRARWTDDELRKMEPDYTPGMLKAWVTRFIRLFLTSIFKWVQSPQAVHLGDLELDRERALQLPVVQSAEWLELERLQEEQN